MKRDTVLAKVRLTLDDHDPRVLAAEAAEKQLYDFYGISHTVRHIVLTRHGIKVRITETGEGDPVVIVPGNTGDGFPFIPLLPHLPGRRIITITAPAVASAKEWITRQSTSTTLLSRRSRRCSMPLG